MSADDYRHSRTDQGFLLGRALALYEALEALSHVAADPDAKADAVVIEAMSTPLRGFTALARRVPQLISAAKAADRPRADELEGEYLAVMGQLDLEALPERWPSRTLDSPMHQIAAAMVYGRAVEGLSLTGRQHAAALRVQERWMTKAKQAAADAVAAGVSEVEAARLAGLSRATVRKALGK